MALKQLSIGNPSFIAVGPSETVSEVSYSVKDTTSRKDTDDNNIS